MLDDGYRSADDLPIVPISLVEVAAEQERQRSRQSSNAHAARGCCTGGLGLGVERWFDFLTCVGNDELAKVGSRGKQRKKQKE